MPLPFQDVLLDNPQHVLALGVFLGFTLPYLPSLGTFLFVNFVRRGNVKKYLHSNKDGISDVWALVTGGSDGIGYGFATELASRGFNVILHGRNKAKLEGLVKQLSKNFPDRQFDILVFDASGSSSQASNFDSLIMPVVEKNHKRLTVLVNNIGGMGGMKGFAQLDSRDGKDTQTLLDTNVTFPLQITRTLLPVLKANKPSLIINVGSSVATHPMPYLVAYGGGKAFNKQFSRALRLEMQAEGFGRDVEVLGLDIARVKSANSGDVSTVFWTPDSRTLAKHALQKVGCGKDYVCAYWPHAIQTMGVHLLPAWLYDKMLVDVGKAEKAWRDKWE